MSRLHTAASALPSCAGSKRKIKMLFHREGTKNAKQIKKNESDFLDLNSWRPWRLGGEN
jgi:hypothetical protein